MAREELLQWTAPATLRPAGEMLGLDVPPIAVASGTVEVLLGL